MLGGLRQGRNSHGKPYQKDGKKQTETHIHQEKDKGVIEPIQNKGGR
jgi:hypothetical protein